MHILYMVCSEVMHQFVVHDDYTLSHLYSYMCLEAK